MPGLKCSSLSAPFRLLSSEHKKVCFVNMILWAVYNLTIWAELHFHSLILQVGVKELQVSFQWLRIIARQTWKVIKVFSLLCLQIVDSGFCDRGEYLSLWWSWRRPPTCHPGRWSHCIGTFPLTHSPGLRLPRISWWCVKLLFNHQDFLEGTWSVCLPPSASCTKPFSPSNSLVKSLVKFSGALII